MIKKFLKDYSKIYKNLTFLYLKLSDKDLGNKTHVSSCIWFIPSLKKWIDFFESVSKLSGKTTQQFSCLWDKKYITMKLKYAEPSKLVFFII